MKILNYAKSPSKLHFFKRQLLLLIIWTIKYCKASIKNENLNDPSDVWTEKMSAIK